VLNGRVRVWWLARRGALAPDRDHEVCCRDEGAAGAIGDVMPLS